MKKIIPVDAVLIPNEATCVFEGKIYDVYQWPQKLFGGSIATFEMLKRADTVVVYCVVDDQLLVLNDEQPHSGARLSFPGGRVDPEDESLLAAAQREVHEETGYEFEHWRLVTVHQLHTKIEWFVYNFVAWDVKSVSAPHLDEGERIEVQKRDLAEVKQLVHEKVGYLSESEELFQKIHSVQDLLKLPECIGREVDR